MNKRHLAIAILCAGVLTATFPTTAHAGLWDKKTVVKFSQAVEVPGTVLQPGKYVMKIVGSPSERNVVQFTNERENHVYATTITISAERMQPPDKTLLTFYEMPQGQPEVLKAWYYPGENIGREFIYPRDRALLISAATSQPVANSEATTQAQVEPPPFVNEDRGAVAPAPESTAPEVAAAPEPKEEPVVIAQNTPPPPPPAPISEPAPAELPKTAGELPLAGLIGVLSLAVAAGMKTLKASR